MRPMFNIRKNLRHSIRAEFQSDYSILDPSLILFRSGSIDAFKEIGEGVDFDASLRRSLHGRDRGSLSTIIEGELHPSLSPRPGTAPR